MRGSQYFSDIYSYKLIYLFDQYLVRKITICYILLHSPLKILIFIYHQMNDMSTIIDF